MRREVMRMHEMHLLIIDKSRSPPVVGYDRRGGRDQGCSSLTGLKRLVVRRLRRGGRLKPITTTSCLPTAAQSVRSPFNRERQSHIIVVIDAHLPVGCTPLKTLFFGLTVTPSALKAVDAKRRIKIGGEKEWDVVRR